MIPFRHIMRGTGFRPAAAIGRNDEERKDKPSEQGSKGLSFRSERVRDDLKKRVLRDSTTGRRTAPLTPSLPIREHQNATQGKPQPSGQAVRIDFRDRARGCRRHARGGWHEGRRRGWDCAGRSRGRWAAGRHGLRRRRRRWRRWCAGRGLAPRRGRSPPARAHAVGRRQAGEKAPGCIRGQAEHQQGAQPAPHQGCQSGQCHEYGTPWTKFVASSGFSPFRIHPERMNTPLCWNFFSRKPLP